MKTVLITGASGFFGKSFLRALAEKRGEDRYIGLYCQNKPTEGKPEIEWVQANLFDPQKTSHILNLYRPTHLVHLAWCVKPGHFWNTFENIDWLQATVHLFEQFCQNGGQHLVGAGTLFEYDLFADPLDENAPIAPQTLYGEAKASTYRLLKQAQKILNPELVLQWVRIGYFFGEGEPPEKFLSATMRKMSLNQPIHAISRYAIRDYGHVKYLGQFLAKILETTQSGVWNASGGSAYPLSFILDRIASYKGYAQSIHYDTYPLSPHEPLTLRPDISKMKALLQQDPAENFIDDLDEMMKTTDVVNNDS